MGQKPDPNADKEYQDFLRWKAEQQRAQYQQPQRQLPQQQPIAPPHINRADYERQRMNDEYYLRRVEELRRKELAQKIATLIVLGFVALIICVVVASSVHHLAIRR